MDNLLTGDDKVAARRIEQFLDLNYPCECGDPRCTGSVMEAEMIVEIVKKVYNL